MRESAAALDAKGVKVIGVSMDRSADQKKFKRNNKIPHPLIVDWKGEVVRAFGVKMLRPGLCARQSFLVRDGKVVWVQTDVRPKSHGEDVLKALDGLEKKSG